MANDLVFKKEVEANLHSFLSGDLRQNALRLLKTLKYESDKKVVLRPNTPEGFKSFLKEYGVRLQSEAKAHLDEWETADFLFQLTDEEISRTGNFFDSSRVDVTDRRIESYLFFAVKLKKAEYRRSDLAEITREINRAFPMPAMILFQHGATLTFSIIDRRLHKRDESKDVLEKVTLIKDIRLENPHRAHVEILSELALDNYDVRNFVELHDAWRKTLDTKELNRKFFQELANWYFWAVDKVTFPDGEKINEEARNATSVIRLITRLMFVWFLKEKGLVSEKLFDEKHLKTILRFQDESAFYKAVLQNLFFAALNSEMGTRRFISESGNGRSSQHFVHNVFRYKREFIKPEETVKELFDPIPFLNGGLFECLDKETEADGTSRRVDGFSDHPKNVLRVPDELFLGREKEIELNEIYGTKNKRYRVRGLLHILNSYKFTIAENTPLEEEIALDPELLGKVFENLLASYNPETKTTARKQTGSFYTPREIVNYMVDESLMAYLKAKLQTETEGFGDYGATGTNQPAVSGNDFRKHAAFEMPVSDNRWHGKDTDLDEALRDLFSYTEDKHDFNELETEILVKAIGNCKILDPACGSGAFPMGILHRLVYLLKKLDKDNAKWKQWQKQKAIDETKKAYDTGDSRELEERLAEINDVFENNANDYGRKLFLIENCIYGVDIQPIAIQIAKLRFFISLIVDQKANPQKENLGIRPLPNLETKFVAANTLIGLETRGGLKPTEVYQLETDLKEVRAKHFGARTRRTKEKYRAEDQRIRSRIAELLRQAGFPATSADQISTWNPYDQNTKADWFDAEYMFGIEKGFGIVIGNPPFVSYYSKAQSIAYQSRDLVDRLKEQYDYIIDKKVKGRLNSMNFFIEKGFDILNENGVLSLILDTSINEKASYDIRKFVCEKSKIREIIYNLSAFENVTSDQMILSLSASSPRRQNSIKWKGKFDSDEIFLNQNLFNEKNNYSFYYSSHDEILKKIETGTTPLTFFVDHTIGVQIGGKNFLYQGSPIKSLFLTDSPKENAYKNIVSIEKYARPEIDGYVVFDIELGKQVNKAVRDANIALPNNLPFLKEKKIILRQSAAKFTATLADENQTCEHKFFLFKLKEDVRIPLKFFLAIINSRLMTFYGLERNIIKHGDKKQPQIRIKEFIKIPIPKAAAARQVEIAEIVDEILETKKADPSADTGGLEEKIDALVFDLYGLTDEEKDVLREKV